jgi:hypothetical protein
VSPRCFPVLGTGLPYALICVDLSGLVEIFDQPPGPDGLIITHIFRGRSYRLVWQERQFLTHQTDSPAWRAGSG